MSEPLSPEEREAIDQLAQKYSAEIEKSLDDIEAGRVQKVERRQRRRLTEPAEDLTEPDEGV